MFSRQDVLGFWTNCALTDVGRTRMQAERLLSFRSLYDAAAAESQVPWYVIGALDYREEDFAHSGYLGNGDPLDRVTTHVPKGRGPFPDWSAGAADALSLGGWNVLPPGATRWDIVTVLQKCERWNGMGYAERGLRTPYVWAGTNKQQRGKYLSDGHFDVQAWDTQLGCAALFLALKQFAGIAVD